MTSVSIRPVVSASPEQFHCTNPPVLTDQIGRDFRIRLKSFKLFQRAPLYPKDDLKEKDPRRILTNGRSLCYRPFLCDPLSY